MPGVEWGRRIAILNDLSPAATFIAHNYNAEVDSEAFLEEANALLERVERECGWLYRTAHREEKPSIFGSESDQYGVMNYCVWSEVMSCPQCGKEIVFFDHAVDTSVEPLSVRESFRARTAAYG